MFCPVCGKQQVSDATRFCSGCGFPLAGVGEVIAAGGASLSRVADGTPKPDSPRKRGIKQGAWVMLVGCFLIVPLIAITSAALHFSPLFVSIAAVLSFVGGLLRIVYAAMFESGVAPVGLAPADNFMQIGSSAVRGSLGPQTSAPVSDLRMPSAGSWRDTNDLQPTSVTESTTRLLEKEGDQ